MILILILEHPWLFVRVYEGDASQNLIRDRESDQGWPKIKSWFDLIWMDFGPFWFDLNGVLDLLIWFAHMFGRVILFDLTPFSHDLIPFEFAKLLSIQVLIKKIMNSGQTNGTDGKSLPRPFDRCHMCPRNLIFVPVMAWFWLHPNFWFEIEIKSWFDLRPNFCLMIWFDLTTLKNSMIWFDSRWSRFWVDLIWFEFAHPCAKGNCFPSISSQT